MGATKWVAALVLAVVVVFVVYWFAGQQGASELSPTGPTIAPPQPEVVEEEGPVVIDLTASRGGFSPERIEVAKGDFVQINMKSTDDLTHGFALEHYDLQQVLEPGQAYTVEFVAFAAGEYRYFTHVASHPGAGSVEGLFVVTE